MNPLNVSFLQEIMTTVAEQGRALLPKSLFGEADEQGLPPLVAALVSGQGEASGVAIAREILLKYKRLTPEQKRAFFHLLADELRPDPEQVSEAAEAYLQDPGEATLLQLERAVESPRQEFFRRLNLAPGATAELVGMRHDLLRMTGEDARLKAVDRDFQHLFYSWFNRGFLVLKRIDWRTPAAILEKIIKYEAVHEIDGWSDLQRRLDPRDRRCFGFFHPSLVDDPLIFVEVALGRDVPEAIAPLLDEDADLEVDEEPTTAVFYSISNCQAGLRGISFGNFLIKQVVEELAREKPSLKTFVTLSPVPTFARWLDRTLADDTEGIITPADREILHALNDPSWPDDDATCEKLKPNLMALAAHYFVRAITSAGLPVDPVARFHLGNGALLERINWKGDLSEKGLRNSHGLMVNYRYDLKDIEKNHEAFVNDQTVVASRAVRSLLRSQPRPRLSVENTGKLLALPGARTASGDCEESSEATAAQNKS